MITDGIHEKATSLLGFCGEMVVMYCKDRGDGM
jgi:hypothetical protein